MLACVGRAPLSRPHVLLLLFEPLLCLLGGVGPPSSRLPSWAQTGCRPIFFPSLPFRLFFSLPLFCRQKPGALENALSGPHSSRPPILSLRLRRPPAIVTRRFLPHRWMDRRVGNSPKPALRHKLHTCLIRSPMLNVQRARVLLYTYTSS